MSEPTEDLLIEQARDEGYAAIWDFRVRQDVRELARYAEDWPGGA